MGPLAQVQCTDTELCVAKESAVFIVKRQYKQNG